ncbi:hypothetical protein AC249_AIPGENE17836 [Exaiptasia diaphana]|nr:hypothetical protein AC249_AIPGENE17836 [Exaiptasia diaphana]
MKFVVLALVFSLCGLSFVKANQCNRDSDCLENQCCMKTSGDDNPGVCKNHLLSNELCMANNGCPRCKAGLTCNTFIPSPPVGRCG